MLHPSFLMLSAGPSETSLIVVPNFKPGTVAVVRLTTEDSKTHDCLFLDDNEHQR